MEKKVLTQEGLNKLKKELDYLSNTKRQQVAERIKQAKEFGDLSENAEYQDAKEEQSFVAGRMHELEYLIKTSEVADSSDNKDLVSVGSQVTVEKNGQVTTFTIVGSTEADPINNKISLESPMGGALLNRKVGEEVEVESPVGKMMYKILEIN